MISYISQRLTTPVKLSYSPIGYCIIIGSVFNLFFMLSAVLKTDDPILSILFIKQIFGILYFDA